MSVRRDQRTRRWFFRTVVRLANGKRKRLFGTPGAPGPYQDFAPTKGGAQEAERRAIAEVMIGQPAARRAPSTKEVPTIRGYCRETFLEKYVPTITKPSARRSIRQILETHVLPEFGELRLDEVRQEHVDSFVAAEKRRRMAVKTINNRLSALSTLLKYARDNGVVAAPAVRLRCKIAGASREIVAVALDDVERMLMAATDDRYRVAVLLATEAGLRMGEIRGLQWGDIRDGQLTVRRALDKETGEAVAPKHNKARTIPLSPRLATELAALPPLGLWVVGRLNGDGLGYYALLDAIGELYDRANVARPPKPVHCLRHTFGTGPRRAAAGPPGTNGSR